MLIFRPVAEACSEYEALADSTEDSASVSGSGFGGVLSQSLEQLQNEVDDVDGIGMETG